MGYNDEAKIYSAITFSAVFDIIPLVSGHHGYGIAAVILRKVPHQVMIPTHVKSPKIKLARRNKENCAIQSVIMSFQMDPVVNL